MGKFELPLPNDNDQHDEIFFDETVLPEALSFELFKRILVYIFWQHC